MQEKNPMKWTQTMLKRILIDWLVGETGGTTTDPMWNLRLEGSFVSTVKSSYLFLSIHLLETTYWAGP